MRLPWQPGLPRPGGREGRHDAHVFTARPGCPRLRPSGCRVSFHKEPGGSWASPPLDGWGNGGSEEPASCARSRGQGEGQAAAPRGRLTAHVRLFPRPRPRPQLNPPLLEAPTSWKKVAQTFPARSIIFLTKTADGKRNRGARVRGGVGGLEGGEETQGRSAPRSVYHSVLCSLN